MSVLASPRTSRQPSVALVLLVRSSLARRLAVRLSDRNIGRRRLDLALRHHAARMLAKRTAEDSVGRRPAYAAPEDRG